MRSTSRCIAAACVAAAIGAPAMAQGQGAYWQDEQDFYSEGYYDRYGNWHPHPDAYPRTYQEPRRYDPYSSELYEPDGPPLEYYTSDYGEYAGEPGGEWYWATAEPRYPVDAYSVEEYYTSDWYTTADGLAPRDENGGWFDW